MPLGPDHSQRRKGSKTESSSSESKLILFCCHFRDGLRQFERRKGSTDVKGVLSCGCSQRDTHHNNKNSGILDVMRILDPFIARSIGYETVVAILCNCFRINVFSLKNGAVFKSVTTQSKAVANPEAETRCTEGLDFVVGRFC